MSCKGAAFGGLGGGGMQKWDFGKREYEEGMLGRVRKGGVGGYGTPLVLQKPGEEDVAILVTAQVLQRRAGMVWGGRGVMIRTGRGSLSVKGSGNKNIYFKMAAKTFTFPVFARNFCWSLSSTDATAC